MLPVWRCTLRSYHSSSAVRPSPWSRPLLPVTPLCLCGPAINSSLPAPSLLLVLPQVLPTPTDLIDTVRDIVKELGLTLVIEPGRSMVATGSALVNTVTGERGESGNTKREREQLGYWVGVGGGSFQVPNRPLQTRGQVHGRG